VEAEAERVVPLVVAVVAVEQAKSPQRN